MEKEIWKDIKGYEGLYQISNLGRVKSLERICFQSPLKKRKINEKIMKFDKSSKAGYIRISLNKDGNKKKYSVHRLVAQTFIPNPHNYPQINHIDENKQNNNINNLEWCTVKYNNNYGSRKGLNFKKIIQFDTIGNKIAIYESINEASRKTNITRCCISNCLNKKQKTSRRIYMGLL